MTTPINKAAFTIIDDEWKKAGIHFKNKRLVFQDPHIRRDNYGNIENQHEAILIHQIKRWHPEKNQVSKPSVKTAEKGLISGFKVHSKALHIIFKILSFLTCGLVKKSMKIVLDGKAIYVNLNSYQKWRRLNGEALNALGILKPAAKKDLIPARQKEIGVLNQLLKMAPKTRPARKNTIAETNDCFGIASLALKLAKGRVESLKEPEQEKLKDSVYQIAAFYILLNGTIAQNGCHGDELRVGHNRFSSDLVYPQELLDRLADAGTDGLNNAIDVLKKRIEEQSSDEQKAPLKEKLKKAEKDLQIFESLEVVYEETPQGVKRRFINLTPDLFNSAQTTNNPKEAKKLLNEIMQKNEKFALDFTSNLIASVLKGKGGFSNLSAQEKQLMKHLASLGQALKDQFNSADPGTLLKQTLKGAFVEIIPMITEDNQYDPAIGNKTGLLAAWKLLKSGTEISDHLNGSKTLTCFLEDSHRISMRFPPRNFYKDEESQEEVAPPFVNPLAGKLNSDNTNAPVCSNEALLIAKDIQNLFSEEMIILEEIVQRLASNPWDENEKNYKKPKEILEEIWKELSSKKGTELSRKFAAEREERLKQYGDVFIDTGYDISSFEKLYLTYQKLEKVGKLIHYRYLVNELNGFLEKVEFEKDGKAKASSDLLNGSIQIKRSASDHKQVIQKYFPGHDIPQRARKEPPKWTSSDGQFDQYSAINRLFHQPHSNASSVMGGSCCVGALSHGIFGKFAANGAMIGNDASRDIRYLNAIRNAARTYMTAHPEQFIDDVLRNESRYLSHLDQQINTLELQKNPSEQQKKDLLELKKRRVLDYANALSNQEWFETAAIKAISYIIERPIHIMHTLRPARKNANGYIEMEQINPGLDGEILFLYLGGAHYDCLIPKRVGSEVIK